MIDIDPLLLNVVAGLVVPFLVALTTKETTSSRVKAFANLALSAILGGLVTLNEAGSDASLVMVVQDIFYTYAMSIASYYGLDKPSGATDKVQNYTRYFGV